ncbi:MAG: hypothetical protein IT243_08315 [Bacteroidia bacterium]|nr:hypothetical protein [Bacteroidia bacterium]
MKTLLIFILGLIAGLIVTYGLCASGNLPFSCDSTGNLIDSTGNVIVLDTNVNQNLLVESTISNDAINKYANEFMKTEQKIVGFQGGTIDLNVLRAVISQISDTQKVIYYRYGYSHESISTTLTSAVAPEGTMYLLLSAGNFNSEGIAAGTGKQIYRNGFEAQSFCPYACD